jgi:TonB family protein
MKKTIAAILVTIDVALAAQLASAGQMVSYIAMPVGVGYATDAKGGHYSNSVAMKDVLFADRPQYPYGAALGSEQTRNIQASGVFRLSIDLNTGRVSQVTVIKSTGDSALDTANTNGFKRWVFRPGKWKEIILHTTVRKKWIAVRAEAAW